MPATGRHGLQSATRSWPGLSCGRCGGAARVRATPRTGRASRSIDARDEARLGVDRAPERRGRSSSRHRRSRATSRSSSSVGRSKRSPRRTMRDAPVGTRPDRHPPAREPERDGQRKPHRTAARPKRSGRPGSLRERKVTHASKPLEASPRGRRCGPRRRAAAAPCRPAPSASTTLTPSSLVAASVRARPTVMPDARQLASSRPGTPSRSPVERDRGVEQRAAAERRHPQAGGRPVGPRVDEIAVEVARLVDPQHRPRRRRSPSRRNVTRVSSAQRTADPGRTRRRSASSRTAAENPGRGASSSAWSPGSSEKSVSDPNAAPIATPRTMTTSGQVAEHAGEARPAASNAVHRPRPPTRSRACAFGSRRAQCAATASASAARDGRSRSPPARPAPAGTGPGGATRATPPGRGSPPPRRRSAPPRRGGGRRPGPSRSAAPPGRRAATAFASAGRHEQGQRRRGRRRRRGAPAPRRAPARSAGGRARPTSARVAAIRPGGRRRRGRRSGPPHPRGRSRRARCPA